MCNMMHTVTRVRSLLQCVAVCRSVLQCVAVCCLHPVRYPLCGMCVECNMRHTVTCVRSLLQCVAVCCSVLQCLATVTCVAPGGDQTWNIWIWRSIATWGIEWCITWGIHMRHDAFISVTSCSLMHNAFVHNTFVYTYGTLLFLCVHAYACVHAVYVCVCLFVCVWALLCVCACLCVFVRACVCVL